MNMRNPIPQTVEKIPKVDPDKPWEPCVDQGPSNLTHIVEGVVDGQILSGGGGGKGSSYFILR